MGFSHRMLRRKACSPADDYEPLIYGEKALPKPPRSIRLIPFKVAHITRLQKEARQRTKLFADPYCGLPRDYLPEEELRYFRYNLTQIFWDIPLESYRISFGLLRAGLHDYYSAILVTSMPGKEPRVLACSERTWHRYPFTIKETQVRALKELLADIQARWDRTYCKYLVPGDDLTNASTDLILDKRTVFTPSLFSQEQNNAGEWVPWWRQLEEPSGGRSGI